MTLCAAISFSLNLGQGMDSGRPEEFTRVVNDDHRTKGELIRGLSLK